ncbi:MAG: 2-C-methyl-D-erythritol 2,4-cyclodiphosphate synthase [Clostridia bacterium]|nr:2-C-methyl-D-erythritol 2,4-cyclodiphosphate synthase [Clostridia bacterium]
MRIGHGYDVHRLAEGLPFTLGGVVIPYTKGFVAHSDGDVLIHAIIDALFGAAGLPDIGAHFPDSDARYKGVSSLALLTECVHKIRAAGYEIGNIDATVIAQAPKIGPHITAMRNQLAHALGIPVSDINVKATTEEHLGFTGTGEGVSAHAVCLLK